MPYQFFNPNPKYQRVGDCAVRAVCKALGTDWDDAYVSLCAEGLVWKDMPSSNFVWGMYLKRFGYREHIISSSCPDCVSVEEFSRSHRKGRYVLATQNHTVCVVDGVYYDSWDSGNEIVLYYYQKEE